MSRRTQHQRLRGGFLLALALSLFAGGAAYWKTALAPGPEPIQFGTSAVAYTVVPGDSLNAIAARYSVSVSAIMTANGITNPNLVLVGARLRIPVVLALSGLPGVHRDVQQVITSYARQYGVSPMFALAIAWQESGFNQSMVSSAGALGVMQVEPGTGVTVSDLIGRPVNLHELHDNVRAGVYWLARLNATYGGNERRTAAAYYQGAGSVSRDGLYQDTSQYVNDVMALEARFGG